MTELRFFLKRTLWFIGILPFAWFLFLILWGSSIPQKYRDNLVYSPGQGFMNLRLQEADTVKDVQLLIVGSSHAYRGIDPRRLGENGIKAFNFGSSLQSPVQTEFLLKKYLGQMKPKVVLFEVGYKTFSSNGVEGAIDLIVNSDRMSWSVLKMAITLNEPGVYNTLAYAFFRKELLGGDLPEYPDKYKAADQYVPGGFVETKRRHYGGPTRFASHEKPFNLVQQKAFEHCLDYLRKHNVKTILIQTPILYDYYTSIKNIRDYHEYFSRISAIHGYYNFSDSIYQETKYFYDHHHLNTTGVEKFNEDLVNILLPHMDAITQSE